jgi:o-succinylbenzoate synthase
MRLQILYQPIPLKQSYRLSFGTIDSFNTFFVRAESEQGIGYGEITPLPGYNHETTGTIREALKALSWRLGDGRSLSEALNDIKHSDPFVVSGIACAYETIDLYSEIFSSRPDPVTIPLAGLCDAISRSQLRLKVKEALSSGYHVLKIKVGKLSIEEEIERIIAAASQLPPDVKIRLDANQAYDSDQALRLCEGIEDISAIALLEQPFAPDEWEETARLINNTAIPIMLDEAIWTTKDVIMAADVGAKWVKLKLCKHMGISESLRLVKHANECNLNVVYGNGVQTALGNHIEAWVHHHANMLFAIESNGFLKQSGIPFEHGMTVRNGSLVDFGLPLENISGLSGEVILDSQCIP